MLSKLAIFISLAVLPFVAAQDTAIGIKAIEAHFQQSHIVEDYLEEFNPTALLTLNYEGVGDIAPGQSLTIPQVRPTPVLTLTPANSSITFNGTYTVAMIDIDFVGADTTADGGVTRHWLVNGASVANNVVSTQGATVITPYAGPGPAAGSGSHRYIVAVYAQPATFTPPTGFTGTLPVGKYDFLGYVDNADLGPLVAANYINVEEGTFTGSAISTAPVVSSTLVAAAGSSSGTGTPSGSAGASGTKSGDASQPSKTSGALKLTTFAAPAVALVAGLALAL